MMRLALLLCFPLLAQQPFRLQPLPFVLRNAATPQKHQIETMPGGVALFDYDNDGRLDIFFANGAPQPSLAKSGPEWWNRLYRNLGAGKFEDVTERAGLRGAGYSMGAAAADYDNDGHTDLLVTGVGSLTLYRNRGDGTFEDATATAGLTPSGWSVSAGWFDFDNDGNLDLFIVNYCVWDPKTEPFCGDTKLGFRTYCHPKFYAGLPNRLYRNLGGGTFRDVSDASGIARRVGKGMGVAFADLDADGLIDAAVSNDTTENFLFRNLGAGKFEEIGLPAGIAITDDGKIVSSMGIDFRDTGNDGLPDVWITALANETFPLFKNLGRRLFGEITNRARITAQSLAYSGWSNGIFDLDNDGAKDLFSANGDVQDNTELYSSRKSRQQNQWYRNRGDGAFDASAFGPAALHRGAAFGDIDGDGAIDAVITRLNEPAYILYNQLAAGRNWLRLRLRGTKSNRDAIGARVRVGNQTNHVTTAVGYLSSSEKTLHFGLGKAASADVEILWPSGARQALKAVPANRYLDVVEP